MVKQLGGPAAAHGWTWAWQRCGRFEYRKCLTRLTNPDHLVPNAPQRTDVQSLRIAARYAAGMPPARRPAP